LWHCKDDKLQLEDFEKEAIVRSIKGDVKGVEGLFRQIQNSIEAVVENQQRFLERYELAEREVGQLSGETFSPNKEEKEILRIQDWLTFFKLFLKRVSLGYGLGSNAMKTARRRFYHRQ